MANTILEQITPGTQLDKLDGRVGEIIKVNGFVDKVRDQKYVQFLNISDGTGSIQVVCEKNIDNAFINEKISRIRPGSTISLTGQLARKPSGDGIEIALTGASELLIHSIASALPVTEESGRAEKLDHRQVSLRFVRDHLAGRVQSSIIAAAHEFWAANDFTIMATPKILGAASESGSEVFELDYFGRPAFLAQSPQFYKQMAIAGGVRAFAEIGPVFRAEPSDTNRHLAEFTMIDMEVAWVTDHRALMTLEESFLRQVFRRVDDVLGAEIKRVFGTSLELPPDQFPIISHEEGRRILASKGLIIGEKEDMRTEAEKVLGSHFLESGHPFYFIEKYPVDARVFYHQRFDDQPRITKSFDLIYNGVEITTGAIREHRPDILMQQAEEKVPGLTKEPGMKNYFETFMYGCPPHGGFAIGLGRLVQQMLGASSIQDVIFLPRTMQRLEP
ncbi:aspartate--tRNA(Asn) ligase [Rhizobium paknamense]|uniref:Aspartyl-tRNA synthetase n=1 Tax=Rhizobium paknamense TaxID=1206817 RepID=A0ABU0IJI8_9HYPH|nr:aspartate--tRNA(Asn) ligase [Rhizobium paknamense]MDQ0458336.1 aspartyl-tRNA synthetase [Rhizobium paknamense]